MSALTKNELAQAVADRLGFSRRTSLELVDELFQVVKSVLRDGDDVKIVRFGTLAHVAKPARKGVSPVSGEPIVLSPRRTVVFRPSRVLKDAVNAEQKVLQDRRSQQTDGG